MADFKRHVTCSSLTGVVLGGVAYHLGIPPATCLVSAGLCGMAGMLPDIDSDTSRSFKTCLHMAAVLGAMLTLQRLRMFRLDHDWIIFAATCVFFFILYVVGAVIRRLTVHRGMLHSLPAVVIAGEFVYLVSEGDMTSRIVKAFALSAGYLSHLILDEVYSFDSTGKVFKIKKSFGTAVKMIDVKHKYITITFYFIAVFLGSVIANESTLSEGLGIQEMIADESPAATSETADSGSTRPTPLKDFLAKFVSAKAKPSEPTGEISAVASGTTGPGSRAEASGSRAEAPDSRTELVSMETASVNLRPLLPLNDEHALFQRRRPAASEAVSLVSASETSTVETVPTIPMQAVLPSNVPASNGSRSNAEPVLTISPQALSASNTVSVPVSVPATSPDRPTLFRKIGSNVDSAPVQLRPVDADFRNAPMLRQRTPASIGPLK